MYIIKRKISAQTRSNVASYEDKISALTRIVFESMVLRSKEDFQEGLILDTMPTMQCIANIPPKDYTGIITIYSLINTFI